MSIAFWKDITEVKDDVLIKLNSGGQLVYTDRINQGVDLAINPEEWSIHKPKKVLFKDWKEGVVYSWSGGSRYVNEYQLKNGLPFHIDSNRYSDSPVSWFADKEFTEVKDETNN